VTVELCPPVREDAAAISAALNEFNVSAGFDLDSPEEVAVGLEFPSFDLDRNTRVALVDGRIAGYSEAYDPGGDGRFVFADVRAANPDASAALLDFVEEHAREIAPGGKIRLWTTERAAAWGTSWNRAATSSTATRCA
jgi:hypothetical protein